MSGLSIVLGLAFLATAFTEWRKRGWHRVLAMVLVCVGAFLLWVGVSTAVMLHG